MQAHGCIRLNASMPVEILSRRRQVRPMPVKPPLAAECRVPAFPSAGWRKWRILMCSNCSLVYGMIKLHQILLRLVRVEGRNDREFLRQKANAGSEDGNGGDEVQGTVIARPISGRRSQGPYTVRSCFMAAGRTFALRFLFPQFSMQSISSLLIGSSTRWNCSSRQRCWRSCRI